MKKLLVIGEGYVGTNLVQDLKKEGHDITSISKATVDYHDRAVLRKYLFNNGIDVVINCAGYTGSPNVDSGEANKELCWKLNVEVPLSVEAVCKDLGIELIHISSGCIYTGYDKEYTEEDSPNFGLFDFSSFYSKTKHAYERLSSYGCILRVRMPITDSLNHQRNYLTKIYKYNNLINYKNSKTYIYDLSMFINYLLNNKHNINRIGVLNFVNPKPLFTQEVVKIMEEYGFVNPNHTYVDAINTVAPRSNCVLSIDKLTNTFPDFVMRSEVEVLHTALQRAQQES
jgi:dTDP-4-dehydrorhamnose reductase